MHKQQAPHFPAKYYASVYMIAILSFSFLYDWSPIPIAHAVIDNKRSSQARFPWNTSTGTCTLA